MKKICKYSIWILIFLLISGIVALSTINQQKTDEVESFANAFPELLRGQDEGAFLICYFSLRKLLTATKTEWENPQKQPIFL